MSHLFKKVASHLSELIVILISTGIITLFTGILIAWSDTVLRISVAFVAILFGILLIYLGIKFNNIKNIIINHFK